MKCSATTKAGKPCQARATASGKCALHANPGRAAEIARKRRNKPKTPVDPDSDVAVPSSAAEVKGILAKATAEVYAGKLDPKLGTAVAYLANVLLRAIETNDLEERIAKLEEVSSGNGTTN